MSRPRPKSNNDDIRTSIPDVENPVKVSGSTYLTAQVPSLVKQSKHITTEERLSSNG